MIIADYYFNVSYDTIVIALLCTGLCVLSNCPICSFCFPKYIPLLGPTCMSLSLIIYYIISNMDIHITYYLS